MTLPQESLVDPKAEGFCYPPTHVTDSCLTYMGRITELRSFVSFYFNFVKTSQALGQLVPKDGPDSVGSQGLIVLKYDYSTHRPLVNQIMISRAVESFDLFLITIMRDIFLSRPEMLKSEGKIDVSTVIEVGSYQDLIGNIVERKLHELSYKPLSELQSFIKSRTGIDLFENKEAFELTLVASEIRNLIAHNDCVINELFKSRTRGVSLPLKVTSAGRIEIDDEWLRRASYVLDGIVFRFDELASLKFGLETHYRDTSLILRKNGS